MKTKRQKQLFKRLDILMTIRDKWIEKNNLKDNQKNFVNHDQSKWLKKYDYIFGQVESELWNLTRKLKNEFCKFFRNIRKKKLFKCLRISFSKV